MTRPGRWTAMAALILVAFTLVLWPALRSDGQTSPDLLPAIIMARLAALPDRSAAFTDRKTLSSLTAPVESSGTLVFRHPDHLEKLTTAPRLERLVIEGGTLTISTAGGVTRTLALDAHPALHALASTIRATLAGDLPALQRLFVVGADETASGWHMVLRPAAPALARFIASVALDGTGAELRQLQIVQANGDAELIAIQKTIPNQLDR